MKFTNRLAAASVALCSTMGIAHAQDPNPSALAVQAHFHLPGDTHWDYLAVDPVRHHLFVSRDTFVQVVDVDSGRLLATIPNMQGVHGFAFVQDRKLGFITNGRGNTLAVIDLDSLKTIGSIRAGGPDPDGILYVPQLDRIFVSNGHGESVSMVDPASRTIIATIAVGGKPEALAADDAGHVFVNIEDKGEIVEIDARQSQVLAHWSLAPCEEPSGLAIDVPNKRLFSTCSNRRMAVVDATNGHVVAQVPIGDHPDAAVFDPDLKIALSSNGDSGTLTVVHEDDPDHYTVLRNVKTMAGAKTMAFDAPNHRIYLASSRFGPVAKATALNPHPRPSIVPGSFEIEVVGRD